MVKLVELENSELNTLNQEKRNDILVFIIMTCEIDTFIYLFGDSDSTYKKILDISGERLEGE